MIDISTKRLIPLSDCPRLRWLPRRRRGRRPHAATFFRWAKHGLRGVRLETIRVGGTLCTTQDALRTFFERLTASGDVQLGGTGRRESRHDDVSQKLDDAGI
jgi:hypothetical protein